MSLLDQVTSSMQSTLASQEQQVAKMADHKGPMNAQQMMKFNMEAGQYSAYIQLMSNLIHTLVSNEKAIAQNMR